MNRQFLTGLTLYILYQILCRGQGGGNRTTCETPELCGSFGVCDSQGSQICSCLQGFYPRDDQEWALGKYWTSGCVRRAPLSCNGTTQDGFLKLPVVIPAGTSERWFGPPDQCEGRCLNNCSCVAYGADSGGCRFWAGALLDIQKSPTGSAPDIYIRVSSSELELDHKKGSKKIVIILVVVGFVVISISTYFYWMRIAKKRAKKKALELANVSTSGAVDTSFRDVISRVNLEDVPLFKFEILANATNNFSEASLLGKGGFGPVYKGELGNGREIAVKRLSQASGQGMQEFMNEVVLISKLQHRNLVRLLGCCVEVKEMMLIYEYMPNKSLDFFLFDQSQEILDWRKRFNIIQGIFLGLLYLHRDSRLKIIHRDLKPSNILLDNDWNPKISDFGMARIFGNKQDHVSTIRVVVDTWLLRRRNKSFHQDGCLNLLGHVWNMWNEDNVAVLIDPRISNQAEVVRCMHIGLLCVQELPKDRPSISAVLSMLSSETITLPEPKQPAFAIKTGSSQTGTSSSQQSQKSSSSINNVTLTTVDGR